MLKLYQTRPALHTTKKSPGFCITCGEIATTEALFKLQGAMIIQRYMTSVCQARGTDDSY